MVEIFREPGDILGVGLSRCNDTQAIIIESMKQASLADRSGALHIGDILLSVGGQSVARSEVDEVTEIIRDQAGGSVRLEVLPGAYARTRSSVRASLPSPCFSTMQRRLRTGGSPGCRAQERLPRQMSHNNLFEMRSLGGLGGPGRQADKERKKFVSFTVELDRSGGPIGITLATEATEDSSECSEERPPPILISSMTEGGLAHRTKAIQLRDELVEVNGINVKGRSLGEAIPLLQNAGSLVKLKLTRVVTIPERECRVPSFRLPPASPRVGPGPSPSPIYAPVQPAASPIYSPVRNNNLQQSPASSPAPPHSGLRSPSFSSSKRSNSSSRTDEEELLTTITLIPQHGPKG